MIAVFCSVVRGRSNRAQDALSLREQPADVELASTPTHDADQREAAARCERLLVLREVSAADVIEDHVGAVPVGEPQHGVGEVLALVIDHGVRAERLHACDLCGGSGHEHPCVWDRALAELHRRRPSTPPPPPCSNTVSPFCSRALRNRFMCAVSVRLADARGLLECEVRRHLHHVARIGRRELCIAAAAEQREHALARRENP
jgi:hypothetical protein